MVFFEPHLALLFILARARGGSSARLGRWRPPSTSAAPPTSPFPPPPPWWAAANWYTGDEQVHRRIVGVGEQVWGSAWPTLYETVDGNPWAAMPSLHFGASALAAILLGESDPRVGVAGWTYAGALGIALVYLGEHYVIDLIAGLGLVAVVRVGEPLLEPLSMAVSRGVQRLELMAR